MNSLPKNIRISLVIVIVTLIGYFIYPFYNAFNTYLLNIQLQTSTEVEKTQRIFFTVCIFFIPLLYFMLEKFLAVKSKKESVFVVISILISAILFWQIRVFSLNQQFKELAQPFDHVKINYQYLKQNLYLELFLIFGIFIGAMIAAIAFKKFKKIY